MRKFINFIDNYAINLFLYMVMVSALCGGSWAFASISPNEPLFISLLLLSLLGLMTVGAVRFVLYLAFD